VLSHAEELLRLKYATVHDLKALLHVITTEGIDGLHRLQLQPMIPIDPMLAKPGKLTLYGGACCTCMVVHVVVVTVVHVVVAM
jgi:hypothetical protein